MKIYKYFKNAIGALWRNKLRSALSTLGIVIGIASVSIMMALGEWMKQMMLESLTVSNNVISIATKTNSSQSEITSTEESSKQGAQNNKKSLVQINDIFVLNSLKEISKYIPNVTQVVGFWYYNDSQWVKFEWKSILSSVVGITDNYFDAKSLKITKGVGFTKRNFNKGEKVIILWNGFIESNSLKEDLIGKQMSLGWEMFTIIGILNKTSDLTSNFSILTPISSIDVKLANISIYVNDIQQIEQTKRNIIFLLMKLSGAHSSNDAPFKVESNDEIIKEINETIQKIRLFLWWVAGLSLLVGGIGIMNIMLVSVTERTREIGIRKSIGARKRDILLQFLVESIVISILWCIIAFLITLTGCFIINNIGGEDFRAIFGMEIIFLSSGISIIMGVAFWLLPAWKAAKLKPIDALRFE